MRIIILEVINEIKNIIEFIKAKYYPFNKNIIKE